MVCCTGEVTDSRTKPDLSCRTVGMALGWQSDIKVVRRVVHGGAGIMV